MNEKENQSYLQHELDDDDKAYITEVFFEDIIPKLRKLHARIGTINCDFAGKQYKDWTLRFKSKGPDFDIIDFEYDEDSSSFSLDL